MRWTVRLALVGLVWILVPWTWGIAAAQLRARNEADGEADAD